MGVQFQDVCTESYSDLVILYDGWSADAQEITRFHGKISVFTESDRLSQCARRSSQDESGQIFR